MQTKQARALTLVASTLFFARPAAAQDPAAAPAAAPAPPAAPAPASAPAAPVAAPAPARGPDGGRFRFGINATAGLESVSASGTSVSGTMYGLDLRLGYQVNDLLAIYAQPHVSFGSLGSSVAGAPVSGGTGTFVTTVMGEVTFFDRLFAGAGLGYGVLNNPSGVTFEARAGGYPLMGRSDERARRKGLMLGGDLRVVSVTGATGILVMGCVGYEAF